MTVEEIFAAISAHMIKGLMVHTQLADYYSFLGLEGYKECHEYHALSESCNYRKINTFYIEHYNKLVPENRIENPNVIPENWYKYSRMDVDSSTKRNGIKSGLEKWMNWETETKQLYEQMYKELIGLNEISAAIEVSKLIEDVSGELKDIYEYILHKKAIDYDLTEIIAEQSHKHKKYRKALGVVL